MSKHYGIQINLQEVVKEPTGPETQQMRGRNVERVQTQENRFVLDLLSFKKQGPNLEQVIRKAIQALENELEEISE